MPGAYAAPGRRPGGEAAERNRGGWGGTSRPPAAGGGRIRRSRRGPSSWSGPEALGAELHDAVGPAGGGVPLADGEVEVVEGGAGDDVAAVELGHVGVVLLAPGAAPDQGPAVGGVEVGG